MPKLIVTANKLNKRSAVPASLADKSSIIGTVNKGFQFEGQEVAGIANAAAGKWYVDRDGTFYWGGGLMELGVMAPRSIMPAAEAILPADPTDYFNLPFLPAKMSWAHDFLHIPLIWKEIMTAGKDVVVAVIDSGADMGHDDLKGPTLAQSIHINNAGEIDDSTPITERLKDNVGHGTQMAGIIAGSGRKVYGIAPQCKLLVVKFTDVAANIPVNALVKAFEWLSTQSQVKVDLISCSLTIAQDLPALKSAVQACLNKGIAVFSAIGESHLAPVNDDDCFPACYPVCTAIGSFDPAGNLCAFSNWNEQLSLIAPGDLNITTAAVNNTTGPGSATSIATAITAGSFALLVSFLKARQGNAYSGRATDHLTTFYSHADDIGTGVGRDPSTGFGRINLRNAISSIKNLSA